MSMLYYILGIISGIIGCFFLLFLDLYIVDHKNTKGIGQILKNSLKVNKGEIFEPDINAERLEDMLNNLKQE